jgi:putative membrane protein
MHRTPSSTTMIAAAVALLIAVGCKPAARDTNPSTGDIGSAADTGAATVPAPTPAPAATAALTDANIVALLDEANQADSAAGALARTKATDPDVKAFAQLMITEHHMLRTKGQELAKKLKITPTPPADDPVQAASKAEMDALRSAPKGPEFDRAYIDQEVAIHKAVIDLAEQAHGATQNAELKALIETAKPYLERHLERAESLQKKLGKPTA